MFSFILLKTEGGGKLIGTERRFIIKQIGFQCGHVRAQTHGSPCVAELTRTLCPTMKGGRSPLFCKHVHIQAFIILVKINVLLF